MDVLLFNWNILSLLLQLKSKILFICSLMVTFVFENDFIQTWFIVSVVKAYKPTSDVQYVVKRSKVLNQS